MERKWSIEVESFAETEVVVVVVFSIYHQLYVLKRRVGNVIYQKIMVVDHIQVCALDLVEKDIH